VLRLVLRLVWSIPTNDVSSPDIPRRRCRGSHSGNVNMALHDTGRVAATCNDDASVALLYYVRSFLEACTFESTTMSLRAAARIHPETGQPWCDCPGCRGGTWTSWATFYRHTDARAAAAACVPAVQPSTLIMPPSAAPLSLSRPSNLQKRPNPMVSNKDTPNKRANLKSEAIEEVDNDTAMMVQRVNKFPCSLTQILSGSR
ncbi:hypothetical protein GGX14DRAFT_600966, partial [Mycena pura]